MDGYLGDDLTYDEDRHLALNGITDIILCGQ